MIFLSHNSNDKTIVEPFANRLAEVFGRDNVFYDSWSIQPGDGIIDKMEEGLSKVEIFFFFVSKNSLQSNMVKLEWQNAIMKATSGKARFIPIRLDSSSMPSLLTQTLYLDVYKDGFEIVLRQMIDVIQGKNTYNGNTKTYENVIGYIKKLPNKLEIEFRAETYMEPISRYAVLVSNSEENVSYICTSDNMVTSGFNAGIKLSEAVQCNAIALGVNRPTSPGFPVKVTVQSENGVGFMGVMRAVSDKQFKMIPYKFV